MSPEIERLTDKMVKAMLDKLKTSEAARAFLIKNGFLTKTGRIPKKYGG